MMEWREKLLAAILAVTKTAGQALARADAAADRAEQAMAREIPVAIKGDKGDSIQGDKGDDGLSAYQIAVELGFRGDHAAWLASLAGPKGDTVKGDKGDQGDKGDKGDSVKGDKGDQGDKGDKGDKGDQGDKGDKGDQGPIPKHRWVGTSLQFEKAPGKWGQLVDLKGEAAKGGQVFFGGGSSSDGLKAPGIFRIRAEGGEVFADLVAGGSVRLSPGGDSGGGSVAAPYITDDREITPEDILAGGIFLEYVPSFPSKVELDILGGIQQWHGSDFLITGRFLSWTGLALELLVESGSRIHIKYTSESTT